MPFLGRLPALLAVQLGQLSVALFGLLVEVTSALRLVQFPVALRSFLPLLLPVVVRIGGSRSRGRVKAATVAKQRTNITSLLGPSP